jgi:hypothetical protein
MTRAKSLPAGVYLHGRPERLAPEPHQQAVLPRVLDSIPQQQYVTVVDAYMAVFLPTSGGLSWLAFSPRLDGLGR